ICPDAEGGLLMSTTSERDRMRFEEELLPALMSALQERQEQDVFIPGPTTRPRRRRSSWAVAAPIVAAALGLALVVPVVLSNGPGGAEPAAAAALHRVALRAAQQPPEPAPRPGQYLYTRSKSMPRLLYVVGDGTTFFFTQPLVRESWLGLDGSGRILNTAGRVTFPTAEDRAAWIAAGSPDLCPEVCHGETADDVFNPGELTYPNYADLPTDPEELLQLIQSRQLVGGPDGDWETFSIIGDLLRETYTPPEVRAALYQVAAEIPGVELVGRVVDGAGRPGVAVAYTQVAGRGLELIFDPTTAELLGENYVNVEDSDVDVATGGPGAIYGAVGPAGTRTFTITYLVSGVVDERSESL
ncbi:MAG TPA: CU044_5270 family protein, partial [Actinomycetota bacterium]|nr:CU044_5270 family protein [Actinomycetota bacterium]